MRMRAVRKMFTSASSKKKIQRAIAGSGMQYTFIMPNNFYQNDENWFREPMLAAGVYPQPFGSAGLSRVDADDIAEAVVRVLLEEGHHGRAYGLVGPDVLTGPQTAEIWSRALGREIRYGGDDLEAWAANVRGAFPDWLLEDLLMMYAFFQAHGVWATQQDLDDTRALLGHEPRSFEAWAVEAAKRWTASAEPARIGAEASSTAR